MIHFHTASAEFYAQHDQRLCEWSKATAEEYRAKLKEFYPEARAE